MFARAARAAAVAAAAAAAGTAAGRAPAGRRLRPRARAAAAAAPPARPPRGGGQAGAPGAAFAAAARVRGGAGASDGRAPPVAAGKKGRVYLGDDDEYNASLEGGAVDDFGGEAPFFEPDDNVIEDGDFDDFDVSEFEDDADDDMPGVRLGDVEWAPAALECCERVLEDEFDGALSIFSFDVDESRRAVTVSIDKPSDQYGAPGVDEIVAVARSLNASLDDFAADGRVPEQTAASVSSPGAERRLRVPEDFERFKDLPMEVTFFDVASEDTITHVMAYLGPSEEHPEDATHWKLAEVKANRGEKGRPMNKKKKMMRFDIDHAHIAKANLHLDA